MRPKKQKITIKNNLGKYRIYKGLRQIELAEILCISTNQYRDIEKYFKYPKYQIRARICNFFNVNQDQMFYLNDKGE